VVSLSECILFCGNTINAQIFDMAFIENGPWIDHGYLSSTDMGGGMPVDDGCPE